MTKVLFQAAMRGRMPIVAGALLVLLLAAVTAAILWDARQRSLREQAVGLDRLAIALAEQAERALQGVDLAVVDVVDGALRGDLDARAMHLKLRDYATALPQVSAFAVADAAGRVVHSSRVLPPYDDDVSGRADFEALRGDPALARFLGVLAPAARGGSAAISVARPVRDAAGAFGGIVTASVDPVYFESLFRRVSPDGGTMSLVHRDTTLYARHPRRDDLIGLPRAGAAPLLAVPDGAPGLSGRAPGPVDGAMRLFSTRGIDAWPLLIGVSLPVEAALASWRQFAVGTGALGGVVAAAILLFALLLQRAGAAAAAARERAVASEQRLREAIDSVDPAISIYGPDERLLVCNRAFLALFAPIAERIVPGAHVADVHRWAAQAGMIPGIAGREEEWVAERVAALRAGPNRGERAFADGRWFLIAQNRMSDGGAVISRMDVTALKQRETLLAHMSRIAGIGAWEIDVATMSPRWSDEVYRIHDLDPASRPDLSQALEFFVPEARATVAKAVKRAFETGAGFDLEAPLITAKGRRIWVRATCQPEMSGGQCVRLLGALQDVTARRLADDALRDSEARFRDFARATGDWVWEFDADLRFTFVSEGVEAATGIKPADVVGMRRDDVADPSRPDEDGWADSVARVERREPFRDMRFRRMTPRGERWLATSGVPVFASDGTYCGYRGSTSDVTEQVETEQRARSADARLREAIERFPESILLCDAENRIVFSSLAFREANAIVADKTVPGTPFVEFQRACLARGVYPDAKGREEQWLAERMAQRLAPGQPIEMQRGVGRWVLVKDVAFEDGWTLGVGVDITARKRGEQILQESEARFRDLAAASGDFFWEIDAEDRFTWVSDGVEAFTGAPAAAIVGRKRAEAFPMIDPAGDAWSAQRDVIERRAPYRGYRMRVRTPRGVLWTSVSAVPVFAPDGTFRGYRGTATDVTAQIALEQRARLADERLRVAIDALDQSFMLTDADDRIVIVNRRMREANPGLFESLGERATFADFIEATTARGQYPEMIGRTAQWLADRRRRRDAGGGRFELRRSDGTWVLANDLPTPDGGTVSTGLVITALKQAQAALELSEARFRDFARASSDWFWEWDADMRWTYLSDGVEAATGIPPAEWVGIRRDEPARLAVTDEDGWAAHLESIRRREPFRDFRFRRKTPKGERWMRTSGVPVHDADGTFLGYRGSGEDVTEQVELARRAQLADERLKGAIDALPHPFVLTDQDDRFVLTNKFFQELNAPIADTIAPGKSYIDHLRAVAAAGLAPAAVGREEAWVADRMRQRLDPTGPFEVRRQDGRWLITHESRIPGGGVAMVAVEITSLKQAQAALQASEGRFRDFASASNDWFWEFDAQSRWTYMSEGVEAATGIAPAAWIGTRRDDPSRLAVVDQDAWTAHLAVIARREPFRNFRFRRLTARGMRWFATSGIPVYAADGAYLGYRGSASDVTDQVEAERQARLADERLRLAIDSLDETFILTDSDDRIVLTNRRFRETNSRILAALPPQPSFEAYLRAGLDVGWYPEANGREEAWLSDRLARRMRSSGRFELLRGDGTWLLVNDLLVQGGGILTVGADISARKRADAALRASEERFRSAIQGLPALVMVTDPSDTIVVCNDPRERYKHYKAPVLPAEVGESYMSRFVRLIDSGRVASLFGKSVAEHRDWIVAERERRRRDPGPPFEMERVDGTCLLVCDSLLADGGLITVAMDITEQKRAQAALRASEARFRAAIESLPASFILTEPDGRVAVTNERFEHHNAASKVRFDPAAGYEARVRRLVAGGEVRSVMGIDALADPEGAIAARLAHWRRPTGSFEAQRADGRWYLVSDRRLDDGAAITISIDITAQKLAQEAAEASEAKFRAAIEGMPGLIFVTDADDRIVIVNSAHGHFDGLRDASIPSVGTSYEEHFRGLIRRGVLAQALGRRVADDPEAVTQAWLRWRRSDPSDTQEVERFDGAWILVSSRSLPGGGVINVALNITDQKRAQEALRANEALFRATVEGMPAHVVLTDAADRIVLTNKLFRDTNAAVAETVAPGEPIEAHLRAAAERGLVREAAGRVEEWLEARMRRFRNPGEPFEQQRGDGSWSWIQETRMPDGGTLSVRTDITRLKNAQAALQASEALFRAAVESLPAGFIMTDAEDRIVVSNERVKEISPGAAVPLDGSITYSERIRRLVMSGQVRSVLGIDGLRDPERVIEVRLARRREPGEPIEFERADGSWFMLHDRRLGDGMTISIATDITALKRAQQAAQTSESRFRAAIESLPAGFVMTDADDRIVMSNERVQEFHAEHPIPVDGAILYAERIRRLVLSGQFRSALGIDGAREPERLIEARLARRRAPSEPIEALRSDGRWVMLHDRRLDDGSTITIGTDITALKRAQQEAQTSEARFRAAIESLPASFVMTDADDWIVLTNERFVDQNPNPADIPRVGRKYADRVRDLVMHGSVREMLGQSFPEQAEAMIAARLQRRRAPSGSFEVERSDGRWYLVNDSRLADGSTITISSEITEQKRALQALRLSEERFRAYSEAAADWYWEQDENLRFTFVTSFNPNVAAVANPSHVGKTRRETLPLDVSEEQLAAHEADLAARRPFKDFRCARIDTEGRKRLISLSGRPWFDEAGTFRGYRGSGRDITAEVARERAASEAQRRLVEAAEASSDGIAYWDADDRLVFCNEEYRRQAPQAASMLVPGLRFADYLRRLVDLGVVGADGIAPERYYAERLAMHGSFAGSHTQLCDGRWYRIAERRTGDGGIFMTSSDVTDLKEREAQLVAAQAALAQSAAMLRTILDTALDAIVVTDGDGRIFAFNRAAEEMFRATADQAIGSDVALLLIAEDQLRYAAALEGEQGDERGAGLRLDLRGRRSDGGAFPLSLALSTSTVDGRRVRTLILRDMSEQQGAEEARRALAGRLRQAERLSVLGMLAGGIAHDFNNIMTPILGYARLLKGDLPDDSPMQADLDHILQAALRAKDMVQRLRAQARGDEQAARVIDVDVVVREAVGLVRPMLKLGVRIEGPEPAEGRLVLGDESQLVQCVVNLAINANDAIEPPAGGVGHVWVGVLARLADPAELNRTGTEKVPAVEISVADDGAGMDEATVARAMQPFFTTKAEQAGTGYGLSIVQDVVRAHGGAVRITSAPGAGTTVRVLLPRAVAAALPRPRAKAESAAVAARGETVLVVDDEPAVLDVIVRILRRSGYGAIGTTSAERGLSIQREARPRLAVIDLAMPEMPGQELAKRLRGQDPAIALLVVTGNLTPGAEQALRQISVSAVLDKPVAPEVLLSATQKALAPDAGPANGHRPARTSRTRT
ncbi:MAG: PAS-domain containing protein [Alphaproteobacteria bacterium]|nr:PAS-domain containing protein [Alphaproteobacteria bacterium]